MSSLVLVLRQLPRILAVVAAIVVMAGARSDAGIVQITNFNLTGTSGGNNTTITAFGGDWQWDQASRDLSVVTRNTSSDYLFGVMNSGSAPNITGAKSMSLTATWTPNASSPDGEFTVELLNNGSLKASALYHFGDFSGGHTVAKNLTWTTNPNVSTVVDQWQIIGNGNSTAANGELVLTTMSVSTDAVPEIDPGSATAALAMVGSALGLLERNRRRLSLARSGAAATAAS